jgi:hypothetical protein
MPPRDSNFRRVLSTPRFQFLGISFSVGIRPLKHYSPISGSRKKRVKLLSSNQSFLGVFQSPRRDSRIQAKSEGLKHLQLSSALSPENIEGKLKQVFDRQLNVADLCHIGGIVAARFFLPLQACHAHDLKH